MMMMTMVKMMMMIPVMKMMMITAMWQFILHCKQLLLELLVVFGVVNLVKCSD